MAKLLTDLVIDRVDLVDEGANSEAFIKLYKRRNTRMNFEELLKSLPEDQATLITSEIAKAKADADVEVKKAKDAATAEVDAAKADADAAKAETAKVKAEASGDVEKSKSTEDVIKSLDPEVQAIFKSLEDKKTAAEAIAKQLKEDQEKEEAIVKAKDLKALPVEESKLVDIAKSASPEVYEVLKAASKLIADSEILKEKGNNSKGDTDAWSKIEKAAVELTKKDGITQAKAISAVIKEQPELYKEYLKGGQ